jgi:hypothetical protein
MQHEIIKQAIAQRAGRVPSAPRIAAAMAGLLHALYVELELLVGSQAAAALYAHAVHRTRSTLHWTLPPTSTADATTLAVLHNDLTTRSPKDAWFACETLLAAVVDHLASLIGEPLTYRLLNSAWNPAAAEQTDQEKFE